MGRQPRSGDIPWPSAHSILNWIGGDSSMLFLFWLKSRPICRNLRRGVAKLATKSQPLVSMGLGMAVIPVSFRESDLQKHKLAGENGLLRVDINSSGR